MPAETKTSPSFDPESFMADRTLVRKPPAWEMELPGVKKHPDPISLGGGFPNSEFFPIKSMEVRLKDKPFDEVYSQKFEVKKADDKTIDLKTALQYASPFGLPHLQKFMKDLINQIHKPAYDNFMVTASGGNANSINKIMDSIFNDGDVLMVDQYNYMPVLNHIDNFKGTSVPLKVTDGKTDIKYLAKLLDNWSTYYPDLPKPKGMYSIPNGSNPYGMVATMEEKKEIYALAEKHNFLIIEDDPYGYIALPKYNGESVVQDTKEEFVEQIGRSFLTIDTCGRVLRIETFSKIFAPGLRLSYIVGHEKFIKSISLYSFIVTGQLPSGPSQILLNNTVAKLDGVDGFLDWIFAVRNEYANRTFNTLKALYESKPYKAGKFTVMEPDAGMFVVLMFKEDVRPIIHKTIETGVNVVPGYNMKAGELIIPEDEAESNDKFIRITTATLTEEERVEALNRLISAIDTAI